MARTTDPRTRPALLGAARTLFYEGSVATTSVGDVAETAGLSKPTLYRHFPSKEDLFGAYLADRDRQLDVELRSWLEPLSPLRRPWGVIEWLCDWICRPGFNGCAFVRACAEMPGDDQVRDRARERKKHLRQTIEEACRSAGASHPSAIAEQLVLIIEGATTMAFIGEDRRAADGARRLGRVALDAAGLARA